jgi:translation elongation factor EF-4
MDWIGEEMGKASVIPHETREIQVKEKVTIEDDGKSLSFNLVDTPGIATKIDFEDFVKSGIRKTEAKKRAKEATKGVIEAIKWLDNMDMVLVVMDASRDPINQVNITILGTDLKDSDLSRIRNAFSKYKLVGISAKTGDNINELYQTIMGEI